jgi:formylglycine-generating enzyme required for sulfatase activity
VSAARQSLGRADLVRLLVCLAPREVASAAALLGYEREGGDVARDVGDEQAPNVAPDVEREEPAGRQPVPFWRPEKMTFHDEPERDEAPKGPGLTRADIESPGTSLMRTPPTPSLSPWPRLWPALREALRASLPGTELDVDAVARLWARGEPIHRFPKRARVVWAARCSVWIDRSRRLVPFWDDQDEVRSRLERVCGAAHLDVRWLDASTQSRGSRERGDFLHGHRPESATPVLLLGDLGLYGAEEDRVAWRRTGERLRRCGVPTAALLPCPRSRWGAHPTRGWSLHAWEPERTTARGQVSAEERAKRAEALLRLVSPALFVQPGLLRAVRRLLPAAEADAGTEADVWNHHPDVRRPDAVGLVVRREAAIQHQRAFVREVSQERRAAVRSLLRQWHQGLPRELWRAETLLWQGLFPDESEPLGPELQDAVGFARRIDASVRGQRTTPQLLCDIGEYGRAALGTLPLEAYENKEVGPSLRTLWAVAFRGVPGERVPPGTHPGLVYSALGRVDTTRWWAVRQRDRRISFSPATSLWPDASRSLGNPLTWLCAGRPEVFVEIGQRPATQLVLGQTAWIDLEPGQEVVLTTDRCRLKLAPWEMEDWAESAGRDARGLWADANIRGVAQRFRWIPPGRFRMGSPEAEPGRYGDEGPQHLVTWTQGRWLADTPVTQELWQAVTGKNPSYFQSADRPVEQVSWDDCNTFVKQLAELAPKLAPRFPTEAEWEFACRAGSDTATWLGDLDILGANNAPLLDGIAWYGGNSGKDFELPNGEDAGNWPDKQYAFDKAGSHPVKQKDPNPHGLFDMLGNVWEWCEDMRGEYSAAAQTDPLPNHVGRLRVNRGGSWDDHARDCRAACRYAFAPDDRDHYLGFRLARGPGPDQGAEPAPRSGSEREAGRGPATGPSRDAAGRSDPNEPKRGRKP